MRSVFSASIIRVVAGSAFFLTFALTPFPIHAQGLSLTRTLTIGSTGAEVTSLQEFLKTEGYYTYQTITGYFGSITKIAVEAYQRAQGISPIGIVGPQTRASLSSGTSASAPAGSDQVVTSAGTSPVYLSTDLALGSKGADVTSLQEFLKTEGYYTYQTITGYFGSITKAAVEAYQRAKGIAALGIVGPQTRLQILVQSATEQTVSTTVTTSATTVQTPSGTISLPPISSGGGGGGGGGYTPPDTTPPSISAITAGTSGATSASISWSTDENATSQVQYGITSAYGATTVLDNSLVATHVVTLSGLTAATVYHFQVRSSDGRGNTATSTDQTFTTASIPVSAPTVTSQAATSVATNSAVFNGTITSDGNASSTMRGFTYGLTTAYTATTTESGTFGVGSFATTTSALSPSTTYHFRAYATNTAGVGYGADQMFTTSALSAPVISAIASSTTQTTASITWTTDQAASSTVLYGLTSAYGSASTTPALTTSHSILLSGLSAGTTYHFQVGGANSAGTVSTSTDQTFVTGISLTGPWSDDFTGTPNAALNGRTVNGLTWVVDPGSTGNTSSLALDSTGTGLRGSLGASSPNKTYGYVSPATSTAKWITRRLASTATASFGGVTSDFITPNSGLDSWSRLNPTAGSGLGFTGATLAYLSNQSGSVTPTNLASSTVINVNIQPGDVFQERYYQIGTTTYADFYENGQYVYQGALASSAGIPFTSNFGFQGNVVGTKEYTYFQISDPATQANISLSAPDRISPVDLNGNLTLHFYGDYSFAAPTNLTYTIYNAATDVAVVGYSNVSVKSFNTNTASSTWSGLSDTVPAASIPATYYEKVCRTDTTYPACSFSGIQRAGVVIGTQGQSLMQQAWSSTGGSTVSLAGLNAWAVDGAASGAGSGAVTSDLLSRVRAMNTTDANAMFATTTLAATGGTNLSLIRGGIGGTTAYQRLTVSLPSFLTGIIRAGGDLYQLFDISGTYDAQVNTVGCAGGCVQDYAASLNSFYSQVEALVGHGISVTLMPLGAVKSAATDVNQQALRRVQYNMTTAMGSRYCLGLSTAHLAHNTTDPYHLTSQAYSEEMRLSALSDLNCQFGGTTYKRGLYLSSASTTNSNTLAVSLYAPNATGVVTENAATTTNGYDQGLQFGTSAGTYALGTLHATSVSCGSPVNSYAICTFGFSGTPFSIEHALIGGPYGINPFNPSGSTVVENSGSTAAAYWMTGGSMLMATYANENMEPIQFYFNPTDSTGNTDYITSS